MSIECPDGQLIKVPPEFSEEEVDMVSTIFQATKYQNCDMAVAQIVRMDCDLDSMGGIAVLRVCEPILTRFLAERILGGDECTLQFYSLEKLCVCVADVDGQSIGKRIMSNAMEIVRRRSRQQRPAEKPEDKYVTQIKQTETTWKMRVRGVLDLDVSQDMKEQMAKGLTKTRDRELLIASGAELPDEDDFTKLLGELGIDDE